MRATVLSALAFTAAAACSPAPPGVEYRPPVLIATLGEGQSIEKFSERGVRFDNAWAHAAPLRPALASLFTGHTPDHHGVTDPQLHGLTDPTLAQVLSGAGWTTHRAWEGVDPLHPRETWGFGRDDIGGGPGSFTWIHQSPAATSAWLDDNPDGHAFVTGLPNGTPVTQGGGHVPLVWLGPEDDAGEVETELVGQIDIAATLAELLDLEPLGTGVSLTTGGSDEVVLLESLPRLTVAGPVRRVVRTDDDLSIRPAELPQVIDLVPQDLQTWPEWLPTDPFGTPPHSPSAESLELLQDAHLALKERRLRDARDALERAEIRAGVTATGDQLTAELLHRNGQPYAAVDLLIIRYESSPADALAYRIGLAALELRDPGLAAPWFDRVLDHRPDHPGALAARIRCARYRDISDIDALLARLYVADADTAARVQLQLDLDGGVPVDRHAVEGLASATDPDARLLLARVQWQHGEWRGALEQANALLDTHPRHIDTRLALATWYLELDEPEPAVRLVGPVARWFPDDLRVVTLAALARNALAGNRWRLQSLRGGWRGRGTSR